MSPNEVYCGRNLERAIVKSGTKLASEATENWGTDYD